MFEAKNEGAIMTIIAPEILDSEQAEIFKQHSNAWLLNPVDSYVIDYAKTNVIKRPFYQAFLQFRSVVKNSNKAVFSINLAPTLLKQIKNDGMNISFSPLSGINEVQKKTESLRKN